VMVNRQDGEQNCLAPNPSPTLLLSSYTTLGKLFNFNTLVSLFVK
jgi:hypothetical protein